MSISEPPGDGTRTTGPSPFMREALAAAAEARGRTGANPWVGAVLVRDGRVVRRAATAEPGGPHAEAAVLEGADARGATLYVTLEPCTPFPGKSTPPCSGRIIEAGISRVVVAMPDADARVQGRGLASLRAAGLSVELGDGYGEAVRLLRPYLKQRQTGLPYVVAKFAASLDGRIATARGESRWITGPAARRRVHEARTAVDAVIAGSGTIAHDDPALTARPGGRTAPRQPLRVIIDSRGRMSPAARTLKEPGQVLVATTPAAPPGWREALAAAGAEVAVLEPLEGKVPLPELLRLLGRRGILTAWCEGGSGLLGALFDAGLVDEVWAFLAPMIIGGEGLPAVGGLGAGELAEAPHLDDVEVERLGPDLLVRGFTSTIDGPGLQF